MTGKVNNFLGIARTLSVKDTGTLCVTDLEETPNQTPALPGWSMCVFIREATVNQHKSKHLYLSEIIDLPIKNLALIIWTVPVIQFLGWKWKNMKRQLAFPKQNRLLARKIQSKKKIHKWLSFLRDNANGNASAFKLLMSKWLHSLLIKTDSITKWEQPGEPGTSWWTQTPLSGKNAGPKRNSRIVSSFWLTGHAEGRKTHYNSTGKSIWRMTQGLQQIKEKGEKEK